jgi:hypothetical protein
MKYRMYMNCPAPTLYNIIDNWKEYCQEAVTANHSRSEIKKEKFNSDDYDIH